MQSYTKYFSSFEICILSHYFASFNKEQRITFFHRLNHCKYSDCAKIRFWVCCVNIQFGVPKQVFFTKCYISVCLSLGYVCMHSWKGNYLIVFTKFIREGDLENVSNQPTLPKNASKIFLFLAKNVLVRKIFTITDLFGKTVYEMKVCAIS